MASETLCEFELEILRECSGEVEPRPWGAAVGAVLEHLRGSGYVDDKGLTDKGRAALRETSDAE